MPAGSVEEPFVFVNVLRLHGSADRLEEIYARVAAHFAAQPGFRSYRLLRSSADPSRYVNVAEWDSRQAFDAAVVQSEFRAGARVGEVADGDPLFCTIVASSGSLP